MSDCSTHAFDVPLKPCPFCGGEAELVCNDIGVFVGCFHENCPIGPQTSTYFDGYATEAEAIAAWNTRAERTCQPTDCDSGEMDVDVYALSCGHVAYYLSVYEDTPNYCPNCGAKVVGE